MRSSLWTPISASSALALQTWILTTWSLGRRPWATMTLAGENKYSTWSWEPGTCWLLNSGRLSSSMLWRPQDWGRRTESFSMRDKTTAWQVKRLIDSRNKVDFFHTGIEMKLKRHLLKYLIIYYLPSGLFVVVSWVSFLIPPDVVPGRMAMLITLFLVLTNIFNMITANSPNVEGMTAIAAWMLGKFQRKNNLFWQKQSSLILSFLCSVYFFRVWCSRRLRLSSLEEKEKLFEKEEK